MTAATGAGRPGDDAPGLRERLERGAERTKEELTEAKASLSAAVDERRGGPATSVADAQAKAAELRLGIERDLGALRARVPDREDLSDRAKRIGVAAGATAVTVAGAAVLLSRRAARRARDAEVAAQARAIAAALARIEAGEDDEAAGGGRRRGGLALLAIGAAAAGYGVWVRSQAPPDELDVWTPPA